MIAYPIYLANAEAAPIERKITANDDPEIEEEMIKPLAERLDTDTIGKGIALLVALRRGVDLPDLARRCRSTCRSSEARQTATPTHERPASDGSDRAPDRSACPCQSQAVALSSGLRQIGRGGKRMRAASTAVWVDDSNPSSADGAVDPGVAHHQADERGGAERQVAAAELVGLDPRPARRRLDVEQPAAVADRQAQFQRERRRPTRPPGATARGGSP